HLLVLTQRRLADDADDAVAMVIVEKVGEGPLAYRKAGVLAHELARRLRQGETSAGYRREDGVFDGLFLHGATSLSMTASAFLTPSLCRSRFGKIISGFGALVSGA